MNIFVVLMSHVMDFSNSFTTPRYINSRPSSPRSCRVVPLGRRFRFFLGVYLTTKKEILTRNNHSPYLLLENADFCLSIGVLLGYGYIYMVECMQSYECWSVMYMAHMCPRNLHTGVAAGVVDRYGNVRSNGRVSLFESVQVKQENLILSSLHVVNVSFFSLQTSWWFQQESSLSPRKIPLRDRCYDAIFATAKRTN